MPAFAARSRQCRVGRPPAGKVAKTEGGRKFIQGDIFTVLPEELEVPFLLSHQIMEGGIFAARGVLSLKPKPHASQGSTGMSSSNKASLHSLGQGQAGNW